eukprot:357613-Chlamydomonas_euryale.AAC.11
MHRLFSLYIGSTKSPGAWLWHGTVQSKVEVRDRWVDSTRKKLPTWAPIPTCSLKEPQTSLAVPQPVVVDNAGCFKHHCIDTHRARPLLQFEYRRFAERRRVARAGALGSFALHRKFLGQAAHLELTQSSSPLRTVRPCKGAHLGKEQFSRSCHDRSLSLAMAVQLVVLATSKLKMLTSWVSGSKGFSKMLVQGAATNQHTCRGGFISGAALRYLADGAWISKLLVQHPEDNKECKAHTVSITRS